MSQEPLLEVRDLRTVFETPEGTVRAVDGLNYEIYPGETLGFVGESGAGKSVTGLSVMNLIESPGRIEAGEVRFKGRNILEMGPEELRQLRGEEIAMIFQDPMTSLNPAYTVGTQIVDVLLAHRDIRKKEAHRKAVELLDDVGIPDPASRIGDYPHQFSGGMRQRALIAMALSCDPELIIADEPTTALDVTIQKQVLDLLGDLQDKYDLSIQLITHDMGVISQLSDRVAVMYAGEIVEKASVAEIFDAPQHPYTIGLLKAIPRLDSIEGELPTIPGQMPELTSLPEGCSYQDRCPYVTDDCRMIDPPLEPVEGDSHASACIRTDEIDFGQAIERSTGAGGSRELRKGTTGDTLLEVEGLKKYFTPESSSLLATLFGTSSRVHAVDDVSFSIAKGETVGLVGESGCGKSTLGRTVAQLYDPDDGTVRFDGDDLTTMSRWELRETRERFQIIFQDPAASLNRRRTVRDIIARPLEIHNKVDSSEEKDARVRELLDDVGLPETALDQYPHEFSGGQKQRIGIARALAVEPDFIIADEPVSALDVSIQAKILNLLKSLQEKYDLTYLFISHDINVVKYMSDRIFVMYLGELVEKGSVEELFEPPYHPYTELLLSSIPQADPQIQEGGPERIGEPPSVVEPPSGCRFHTRCQYSTKACETTPPADIRDGQSDVKCHVFDEGMAAEMDDTVASLHSKQESVIKQRKPKASDNTTSQQ